MSSCFFVVATDVDGEGAGVDGFLVFALPDDFFFVGVAVAVGFLALGLQGGFLGAIVTLPVAEEEEVVDEMGGIDVVRLFFAGGSSVEDDSSQPDVVDKLGETGAGGITLFPKSAIVLVIGGVLT